jgi:hypothetical protein
VKKNKKIKNKKKLRVRCGREKINVQEGQEEKKVSWEKNNKSPIKRQRRKRKKVLTKEMIPWGDSFIHS